MSITPENEALDFNTLSTAQIKNTFPWGSATTLTERLAIYRSQPQMISPEIIASAQRRLQRWREQPPFHDNNLFQHRLNQNGLSEEDLLQILAASGYENVESTTPAWFDAFCRVMSCMSDESAISLLSKHPSIIAPFVQNGHERLRQGIDNLTHTNGMLPIETSKIEADLLAQLERRLGELVGRAVVLDLHIARLRGQLVGTTANERFNNFIQSLYQPGPLYAMLTRYPVLARQLILRVQLWLESSLEFLDRLCKDWASICDQFTNGIQKWVSHVTFHGDPHNGGRSVIIAELDTGVRIVYKPRSMAVDVHFQQLLTWLNHRGADPAFRTLTVVDRGAYGWMEYVAGEACNSPDAIQRFYTRQGSYLALLYALEATDIHYENLIAAGEHPVLIDLEALFHPHLTIKGPRTDDHHVSVLRVGLLPQRLFTNEHEDGVDLSGIGGTADQLTPTTVPYWEEHGTDTMRLGHQHVPIQEGQNQPQLAGQVVDVQGHEDAVIQGFKNTYHLLVSERKALLESGGPLSAFQGDQIRVVLRPSRVYARMLSESSHPDLLRDALDQDQWFDKLWVAVPHMPHLAAAVPTEHAELLRGDIPLFTTQTNTTALQTSDGHRIDGLVREPSIDTVYRRILQLNPDDLAHQCWCIEASFAAHATNAEQPTGQPYEAVPPIQDITKETLIESACAVGDRLLERAIHHTDGVWWLGLTLANRKRYTLTSIGLDLYDGLPGVALFLAHLGAITNISCYTNLAYNALQTIQSELAQDHPIVEGIGGFSGWGGLIYTYTKLGKLWNDPTLYEEASTMVEHISPLIAHDTSLDLLGGSAGCISALLALHHEKPNNQTLATAIHCGDWLIQRAQKMPTGTAWKTTGSVNHPLTGFAHGAAGIACALLDLASISGREDFREVGIDAIAYERSLYDDQAQNWPDLRDFDDMEEKDSRFPTSIKWCHGAPGIGIGRLRALAHLDEPETHMEIAAALQTTIRYGFGLNHSLCHGDLGNLDFVLQARETLVQDDLSSIIEQQTARTLASIAHQGWLCGVPGKVETPGLMTGIAGIGYELLRLAKPDTLPAILALT